MTSSVSKKFSIDTAEQFIESVSEPSSTVMYLTYGKVDAWANDLSPDVANTSIASEYEVWKNMIGGKKVTGNDMKHIIPRYDWKANTKYIAYDHLNSNLLSDNVQFYVLTSSKHVYKCLANNYSANSTVEPTAINPNTITQTADGYIWKYMFTVSDSNLLKFTTGSYMPVTKIVTDDGSLQWDVQEAAVDGAVYSIVITNGGSNYTNNSNLVVSISGDGQGLSAYANVNTVSNLVSNVTIIDPGSGYTEATVTITGGGGSGATARAIISPIGGHGSSPLYELGANRIMLNARLVNSEGGILPVTNEFRQIALIKDPLLKGTSNVSSNAALLQAYKVTTAGSGSYLTDEYVYQGATLATASFKGKVLTDNAGEIIIVNTYGTPTAGTLLGANSATARLVTSSDDGELQPYSGDVLYIDNIKPITRSSDQTEDFKIVLKF